MKAQSALEFLTTYGFMFVLISVALLVVLVLTASSKAYVPTSCSGINGLSCLSVTYATNGILKTSNVVLVLTNAQSVPVNVMGIMVSVNANVVSGGCSQTFPVPGNTFLYPGNTITCGVSYPNTIRAVGTSITGAYAINALFCNSGVTQLNPQNCAFDNVIYTGDFSTQVIPG